MLKEKCEGAKSWMAVLILCYRSPRGRPRGGEPSCTGEHTNLPSNRHVVAYSPGLEPTQLRRASEDWRHIFSTLMLFRYGRMARTSFKCSEAPNPPPSQYGVSCGSPTPIGLPSITIVLKVYFKGWAVSSSHFVNPTIVFTGCVSYTP